MNLNDKNQAKSRVLENKGDTLVKKDKFKKAFECYEAALLLDENRIELYDKIIALHEKLIDKWSEEDFAYNLELTMRKQEIVDPTFKRLNSRHKPEYKNVLNIIKKMLAAQNAENETVQVEEIVACGEDALYPLIDFILGFKEIGKRKK